MNVYILLLLLIFLKWKLYKVKEVLDCEKRVLVS